MSKQAVDVSSNFRIFETEEFTKKLGKLSRKEASFLQRKLQDYICPQLRKNPFLGLHINKLRGYSPDTWRYRIGDFRLFFFVDQVNRVVFILSLDDRSDAYR